MKICRLKKLNYLLLKNYIPKKCIIFIPKVIYIERERGRERGGKGEGDGDVSHLSIITVWFY